MQESKLGTRHALAIQSTYTHIELALTQGAHCLDTYACDKYHASANILIALEKLLSDNTVSLEDLSYVGVNCGPGPFTTLRVALATVNGLAFARGLPLVGIDGINAALLEHAQDAYPLNVYLLNAFNRDVYFGVRHQGVIDKGCMKIDTLIQKLAAHDTDGAMYCFGSGTLLYEELLLEAFGERVVFPEHTIETCSIEQIARQAFAQWSTQQHGTDQVVPIYLKQTIM